MLFEVVDSGKTQRNIGEINLRFQISLQRFCNRFVLGIFEKLK